MNKTPSDVDRGPLVDRLILPPIDSLVVFVLSKKISSALAVVYVGVWRRQFPDFGSHGRQGMPVLVVVVSDQLPTAHVAVVHSDPLHFTRRSCRLASAHLTRLENF